MFAFLGVEIVTIAAAESENPEKEIALAEMNKSGSYKGPQVADYAISGAIGNAGFTKKYSGGMMIPNVENNNVRTASSASNDFAPINRLATASKRAFASKAAELGFPQEYVQAMLGTTKVSDNLSKIKKVLSSDLESNVKIAAASSMVKTATLSDSDYSRLVDYWKNELGYGDQEWIDALFTKKYDK
jgi:hypothetical protein